MDCQVVHQVMYTWETMKIISTITQDNTIIESLNHNIVQDNGTDSQENTINHNNNLSKHIWSGREIERLIAIDPEERLKGYGFMERLKKR